MGTGHSKPTSNDDINESENYIQHLPPKIVRHMASYLPPSALGAFSQTCHRHCEISMDFRTSFRLVKSITVGNSHTICLLEDGQVLAWGSNYYGQLGLGDTKNRITPTPIPGLTGVGVKSIAAGGFHTICLLEDGRVVAWGGNNYGQLGLGDTENRNTPVLVFNPNLVFKPNSKLNNLLSIDQNNWATTLICAVNSNHAELVIEGVDENNNYFMKLAHFIGKYSANSGQLDKNSYCGFNGLGEVKLSTIQPGSLRYDGKTQTWLKLKNKVEAMLKEIEKEQDMPNQNPRQFNILGRDSIFAQGKLIPNKAESIDSDSCFTWAREKLTMLDVNLPENKTAFLVSLTRKYTNPGKFPFKPKSPY